MGWSRPCRPPRGWSKHGLLARSGAVRPRYQSVDVRQDLADFLGRERRDLVDIAGVDEGTGRVDVEPGEPVLLGQANVEDRQVALQVGLLVDHQVLEAALHRLRGI